MYIFDIICIIDITVRAEIQPIRKSAFLKTTKNSILIGSAKKIAL
jgi:hypothetical protein